LETDGNRNDHREKNCNHLTYRKLQDLARGQLCLIKQVQSWSNLGQHKGVAGEEA